MPIDRKALRETLAQYRAWNEDKFLRQVLQDRQKTPAEKWREYQDMYDFVARIKPEPSVWEQESAMEEWATYFERIRRFEEWRRRRGKTA